MTGYDTSDHRKDPRILIFDIETTPMIGYTWGKWQQNVLSFIENSYTLCFAYRWYGTDEPVRVISQRQFKRDYKRNRKDDYRVTKAMWNLFDEADIVIAHNGTKFDVKKMNARFAVHKLGRPSPFQQVDTLRVARSQFAFASHSLNDLGSFLGLGQKLQHTGFDLWVDCMAGIDEAWQMMEDYNEQDVVLLEELYTYLLHGGWITRHPSLALINGENHSCPACGSHDRQKRGLAQTTAYIFQRYQCNNCNTYYRDFKSIQGSRSQYRQT